MGRFSSVGTRVSWGLDARTKAQIKIVANERQWKTFTLRERL
jgi:hypothetical protein